MITKSCKHAGLFYCGNTCSKHLSTNADCMAEIQTNTPSPGDRRGMRRSKKLSTKVDLTPMVDLGFLLITFFVFTTSMTKPVAMNLIIPADGPPVLTGESKTLNLVLTGDNKVHFYQGNEVGNQGCVDFSPGGVREVLRQMLLKVKAQFGKEEQAVVLIRPTAAASYQNLVDILDEIQIAGIKKYALMDEPDETITNPKNIKQPC